MLASPDSLRLLSSVQGGRLGVSLVRGRPPLLLSFSLWG